MSSIVLALAALAATANAHGALTGIVADGVYFPGYKAEYFYSGTVPDNVGWSAENLDNGYVGGDQSAYDSPEIICHKNAKPGASKATVKAGGTLEFQWNTWPESHIGPVITYAANCGGDCSAAKKEELKWVKVDAKGLEDGKWAAVEMIANNNTWAMTVPSTLAAGDYVFRHEIIALHSANNKNGAQNYPQCVNVEVTGDGTENPEGTLGTALYTAEDKGILFNPYGGTISSYEIPGPALFGSGSGSSPAPAPAPAPGNSTSPAPSSSAAASAPASAPTSSVAASAPASTPTPSQPAAQPAPTTLVTSAKPAPTAGAGSGSDAGAAVAKYGQCGGKEYKGTTACADNWVCKEQNPYYSQCVEKA